ncbi:MAG: replicative DNA helicase [Deltaproteobacteria bacterium]|nr:replicative DNA helicase [Deltaproteobacteria bacterium]
MPSLALASLASSGKGLPPQALEAEVSLLGSILLNGQNIHKIVDFIRPDDFYKGSHRKIFEAMVRLAEKAEPIDTVTLSHDLENQGDLEQSGGRAYLAELASQASTTQSVMAYAKIIREKAMLRQALVVANEMGEGALGPCEDVEAFLDRSERQLFEISERNIRQSFYPIKSIVKESFKNIEKLYENKSTVTGMPTGYKRLNEMTSGFQAGDLVIVAGRPSMGKTAFALNLALNGARQTKQGVAIYSLEMSKEQLVQRMLCSEAKVDSSKLRGGFLKESDWPKLTQAASTLSESPLFIDDTPAISVLEMRAKSRRLKKEHQLGMIVVDYLQLMRSDNTESREREISDISRSLKALAKELSVPVIALSQLNRSVESRQEKKPQLSDLRESGAIEQDADVILFIYRDEVYNRESPDKGVAEIIIGKQRNGPIGHVRLKFFNEYTRFEDLEENFHKLVPDLGPPPVF